jgi:hypothetical protein
MLQPLPTNPPSPEVHTGVPSPRPDEKLAKVIKCASNLSSMDIDSKSDPVRWKAMEYFHTEGGKGIDTNHCENMTSLFSTV